VKSLESRLGTGLLLALLAVFVFLFWASVTVVSSLAESYVSTRLEHDAESLLGAVWFTPDGRVRMREGRITPIYRQPLSGHYYVVTLDEGRQIRSRSMWDETVDVPTLEPGTIEITQRAGPDDQWLLMRSAGYRKNGLDFTLTTAEDLAPMAAELRRFQILALLGLAVALIAVLLSQRYVLRRSFRALDAVRDEMREVAEGDRLHLQSLGPSEIRPLTCEVNRLLQQLRQRLVRSRQALGNLAHALKTPLSLVTHDLDALPIPDRDRRRLSEHLRRVVTLIERELKRAQIAGEGSVQRFVAARDVPELLDALRRLHTDRSLVISSGGLPDRVLPFDHEDMLELLGNLLDNACKWAERQVTIDIELGDALSVVVADDGPGVAAGDRATLLRRGSRLDEQEPGSGLGLAIVRDLVAHYGGNIALGRSAMLGGFEVRVDLPLPHSATGDGTVAGRSTG